MNKLLGFYELKDSLLPTVRWKEYKGEALDENCLWTVRTAVFRGDDLNLPRCIGVRADEAEEFARRISEKYKENGLVVYYPFFCADKSGTLNVSIDRTIIEAVKDDLWNLVTNGFRDVTIIIENEIKTFVGNEKFMTELELSELLSYVPKIKQMFRDDMLEGKEVQLEWSFAYNSDINKNMIGERYLVFYEARTIQ